MNEKQHVQDLLRPTEHCEIALELRYIKTTGERRKRIIAVIVNSQGGEEACVFILYRKLGSNLAVQQVLPIYHDFQLSVSQSKPLDVYQDIILQKTGFIIKLTSGEVQAKLETLFLESLQILLIQLKKSMNIAREKKFHIDSGSHSWIQYYLHNVTSSELQTVTIEKFNTLSDSFAQKNPFIRYSKNTSISAVKESWVYRELRKRQDLFCRFSHAKFFVGTWNVNGQSPSVSLDSWLDSTLAQDYDFYILGLQELDLSTEAYIITGTAKEQEWSSAIEKSINKNIKYIKITSKQLVTMLILVYAKDTHKPFISQVSEDSAGTGLLGRLGNKGGVGVRFKFHDSHYTFINSHLAADVAMIEKRNQDFQEISRRISFSIGKCKDYFEYSKQNPWIPNYVDCQSEPNSRSGLSIFDSDHLIWMGDLNYRISISDSAAKCLLEHGDIEKLLEYDQLGIEQSAGRVFIGYTEAPISFLPTYKYQLGTSEFVNSEKKRSPSWCDRILYYQNPVRINDRDWIKVESYSSSMDLMISDHKPVKAIINCKNRTIIPDLFDKVSSEVARDLDLLENESIPILDIDQQSLEFEDIRYGVPSTKSIIITNNGKVISQYKFIPKFGTTSVVKPWCFISPMQCALLPGENLCVNLTILVGNESVHNLNMGEDRIDDILILHVDRSSDFFISVSGKWLPTSFGTEINLLCHLLKPIRVYDASELTTASKESKFPCNENKSVNLPRMGSSDLVPVTLDKETPSKIPKELWRMVDFLYRYGMDIDNLFSVNGEKKTMNYIRECIDTGTEFDASLLLEDDLQSPEISDFGSNLSIKPKSEIIDPYEVGSQISLDLELLLKTTPKESKIPSISNLSVVDLSLPQTFGRANAVHSVADTLLRFLESLEVPVIPYNFHSRCTSEGYISKNAAERIISELPTLHYNAFVYIISFMTEISNLYIGNGDVSIKKLASIFAPVILPEPKMENVSTKDKEQQAEIKSRKIEFLMYFLESK